MFHWWEIPLYAGCLWLTWNMLVIVIKVIKSCWK